MPPPLEDERFVEAVIDGAAAGSCRPGATCRRCRCDSRQRRSISASVTSSGCISDRPRKVSTTPVR